MNATFNTLLINDELFKLYSPIRLDSFTEEYTPYVLVAQEQHIRSILGTPLYEQLQEQICNDTLTPLNSKLVVKIAPALANLACYVAAPFTWTTWNNKGITKMSSENSDAIDIKDLAQLRTWLLDIANAYLSELQLFLNKNKTDYPLYGDEKDDVVIAHPQFKIIPVAPRRQI